MHPLSYLILTVLSHAMEFGGSSSQKLRLYYLPPTRVAVVVKTHLFHKYLKVMECQRVMFITLDPNPPCQFHAYATNIY